MQNHNDDTIKTSDTVLRKIYISLYLKGLCVIGSWRPNRTVTYWPPLYLPKLRFFPVLLGCSTGGLGPSLCGCWFSLPHLFLTRLIPNCSIGGLGPTLLGAGFLYRILSPTGLISKLTDFLSSPSYIIVQRPPSCGRHNRTHSTRPRSRLYSDIPWADAPVIYIGAFPILTARPGRRSIYNSTNINNNVIMLRLTPL